MNNKNISVLSMEDKESILKKALDYGCKSVEEPGLEKDPLNTGFRKSRASLLAEITDVDPLLGVSLQKSMDNIDLGPVPMKDASDLSVVLSVLVGGIAGRLLISSLLIKLGASDLWAAFAGTILGSATTAFLSVKLADKSAKWLKWGIGLTGGLFLLRLVGLPSFPLPFRRRSSWTLLLLPLFFFMLILCRRKREVDYGELRIRLDLALRLDLARAESIQTVYTETDSDLSRVLPYLYSLKSAPRESLEASVESLLSYVSSLGYDGLGGLPVFVEPIEQSSLIWNDETREFYDAFGCYEEGQTVIEERPPVIKDGELLNKGMVRRERQS